MHATSVFIRRRETIQRAVVHIVLIAGGLLFVLPFIWMLSTSLKPDSQIFAWPPQWIPKPFMWSNYPSALTFAPFGEYFRNTLLICVLTVLGTVLSSSVVAYGFSKVMWKGRNVLFVVMLSTMMLPYQVTMVPVFILFKDLGWIGSFKPLIVPAFFGNAFYIFLLRQFYMTIPNEISEAAFIDGCSRFGIFWRIILPLSKPALATVGLFTFIDGWNDFLGPLIYLNNQSMYTIALGLQNFVGQHTTEWSLLMAASLVATIPILILFFLTQKTFIQGITMTGLKG